MTSPLRRKHPTTPPSIPRSIRLSLLALVTVGFALGCGATPELVPNYRYTTHRPAQPAAKTKRNSRFADIKAAKFFEAPPASPRIPLAPPPAEEPIPAAFETADDSSSVQSCRPGSQTIQPVQARAYDELSRRAGAGMGDETARPPVDDPRKLKRITEIEPYSTYEPDPIVRSEDPCRNLCPRPDGAPCPDLGDETPSCPEEVVLSNELYESRHFAESVFAWEASNISYNPIYFEDVPLERYGHTYPCWIQPFASVGKFGVQLVGLPYQMAIHPPCKRIYPLGYYRPGECAPKLHYQIPWNTRAALTQAAVTTGMIFLIP